jgi:hypothetical protein
MSNIDLSRIVTAEARANATAAAVLETHKAECRARIFAVADAIAQMNLAAIAAAGMLAPDQMTVYRAGLAWIDAMRAACATGTGWPKVPDGVAELAARF